LPSILGLVSHFELRRKDGSLISRQYLFLLGYLHSFDVPEGETSMRHAGS
jgi:hypothetical protein